MTRRVLLSSTFWFSLLIAPAAGHAASTDAQASAPIIAAASDLQFALEDIAAHFSSDTGHRVRLVFGSSGNFARQIRQGAPYALYLSADEDYALDLARDGFTLDQGVLYGIGRIALMVPHNSPLDADGSLESLGSALAQGEITRFSIANPDHAPYGKRAEEVLRSKGLWEAIQPFLVMGENVSQAAQFAASGNAEGGIIAYSLAIAPALKLRGRFELIPGDWHSPLRQRMVLLQGAGPVAESFYRYMQQAPARQLLEKHGFTIPGEVNDGAR